MDKKDFSDLFAFRKMMTHLHGKIETEIRRREQMRLKIAIRTISKWQKEGEALFESNRRSKTIVTEETQP